jgi:hypothetical protein
MKNSILKSVFFCAIFTLLFSSCSSDDNDSPATGGDSDLGTFVGNFQVSDDPQTDLGYLYNATVNVKKSGDVATIKVTGNDGFDRTYKGAISFSNGTLANIGLNRQTLPVDKTASGACIVNGNDLTMDISLLNDNITVRDNPTSTTSFPMTGKLRLIGTNLIKQ